MASSAIQQVHDIVADLWDRIGYASADPGLLTSFRSYIKKNPSAAFVLLAIKDAEITHGRGRELLSSDTEWLQIFRDPFAQSMSMLKGRLEAFNDGQRPVRDMDRSLALLFFYLEKTQTKSFRRIFNIRADDKNDFADFLSDIEERVGPKLRALLPDVLSESENTPEGFDGHYASLEHDPPRNAKKIFRWAAPRAPS